MISNSLQILENLLKTIKESFLPDLPLFLVNFRPFVFQLSNIISAQYVQYNIYLLGHLPVAILRNILRFCITILNLVDVVHLLHSSLGFT